MGFDWKAVVKTVAPALGTMLGGPLGGIAATAITSALGIEADSTEDQIAAAVRTATPEQLLALKNAENQFKVDMERIGLDYEKVAADDRDSARKREVTLSQAGDLIGARATHVVATIVTIGFFVVLFVVLGGKVSTDNQAALLLLGTMSAGFGAVVQYYLGSSLGSKVKTDALTSAVKK
jgi:uncharacterized membrane protein